MSAHRALHPIASHGPLSAELVRKGKVKVVAARYKLDDGEVEFRA